MKIKELKNYLNYANPDLDVMLITRETYDRLMYKAKCLDKLKAYLYKVYKDIFDS